VVWGDGCVSAMGGDMEGREGAVEKVSEDRDGNMVECVGWGACRGD
jgi:hypothetical protein